MSDIAINTGMNKPAAIPVGTAAPSVAGGTNDGKVKDKTAEVVREVASLIQKAITVTTTNQSQIKDTSGASGKTGVPVLDDPEDIKAIQQDLEKLVAFLQLDNDQRQSEMARARIESQQSVMDKMHADRLGKIDESIKAAKKAEKAAMASRIFGWLGAIVSVIAAVVVTVVTGGAAAGFAIAGAALAVSQLVLSETGAADKIVEAMAKSMEKTFGLKSSAAKAWAAGIYSAMFVAASLATAGVSAGVSFSKATADVLTTASRIALFSTQIANVTLGLGSTATGAATTALNYDSAKASAKVSDVNRYVKIIQQMLEESEEELEQIMNQIQSLFNQIVAIVQSKTETDNLIVQNMSQMI